MSESVKDYPPYLDYPKPKKKQTNGDRIRAMTDEELMRFCISGCPPRPDYCCNDPFFGCEKCWLDWLEQEVEDGH